MMINLSEGETLENVIDSLYGDFPAKEVNYESWIEM